MDRGRADRDREACDAGTTCIMATHDETASRFLDRTLVMHDGRSSRTANRGSPAAMRPRSEVARSLEHRVDIWGVSRPVKVFCWLGWKQPRRERADPASAA
jgi:energy-coupling factor transporter ATP-binding protein EcfA2